MKKKGAKVLGLMVVLVLLGGAISGIVSAVNQSGANLTQPRENDALTETATLRFSYGGNAISAPVNDIRSTSELFGTHVSGSSAVYPKDNWVDWITKDIHRQFGSAKYHYIEANRLDRSEQIGPMANYSPDLKPGWNPIDINSGYPRQFVSNQYGYGWNSVIGDYEAMRHIGQGKGNLVKEDYDAEVLQTPYPLSSNTIYVPDDYLKIQWAVDNASEGDTIIVRDGNYIENVDVDVHNLTIKSENGSENCIVYAANPDGHVFSITASHVNISSFTVANATGSSKAGISLKSTTNTLVTENAVDHCYNGLSLSDSSYNKIVDNNFSENAQYGLVAVSSSNNQIWENRCLENSVGGMYLGSSSNLMLIQNEIRENQGDGIYAINSSDSLILQNTIRDNGKRGLYVQDSSNNLMYLNDFVNNTVNVDSYDSDNRWNSSALVNYSFDGSSYTNFMGNYWDDYAGGDGDGDGIGETAYDIYEVKGVGAEDDFDCYPLNRFSALYTVANEPPVAAFSFAPLEPLVDQLVTFDASQSFDTDGVVSSYQWEFGDGATETSAVAIVTHSYSSTADYTVNLTVIDYAGASSTLSKVITVRPYAIYNLRTGEGFVSLQDAIDAPTTTNGDVLEAAAKTYTENVKVNKSLAIQSASGNPGDTIVQAADPAQPVVEVIADSVTITGFTLTGATGSEQAGIYLNGVSSCTITNNYLVANCYGLSLVSSPDNQITSTTFSSNSGWDIYILTSEGNEFTENTLASYPTTVTFQYAGDLALKGVTTPPPDPAEYKNIRKYVKATKLSADAWLQLNVSYTDDDLLKIKVNESTLRLFRYDGESWHQVPEQNEVNTVEKYVTANITEFSLFAPLGVPRPLVHNRDTGEDFCSIQDAIDAESTENGDIIEVDPEWYTENVWVYKSLTIQSTSGDPADTIVEAADPYYDVFFVDGSSVTIRGFMIKGAYAYYGACGVFLYYATSSNISGNELMWSTCGIGLWGSTENTISNNCIANSLGYTDYAGIALYERSDYNTIDNNVFYYNQKGIEFYPQNGNSYNNITNNDFIYNLYGILIWGFDGPSDYNNISGNSITDNYYGNMILAYTSNNCIEDNDISNSLWGNGIDISGFSSNNKIRSNTINNNGIDGILLWSGGWPDSPCNNIITDNTANFNKYSGIELADFACYNNVTRNTAQSNSVGGIGLFYDTSNNIIAENELTSNFYGLAFIGMEDMIGNQIYNNTISDSKTYGLWVLTYPLLAPNYIYNNDISNNNLFGILVQLSTNISIYRNTVNSNIRGIGLEEASDNLIINNAAYYNEILGISLINATRNTLSDNIVEFNTYHGIYLSNSYSNEITQNKVASSYFGISLYAANDNIIVNNTAESIYYYQVFNYSSTGNTILGFAPEDIYDQTEIVQGVRLSVPESISPSLQFVDPGVNATYLVIAENLGNVPDTFQVTVCSGDNPAVVALDRDSVTLGPGAISASVIGTELDTITVSVTDAQPGIYRTTIEAASQNDPAVKDSVETWTIVRGVVGPEPINTTLTNSAIVNSAITNSTIFQSVIETSTLTNATITNSIIKNSVITNTELCGVLIENAIVTNSSISNGTITINNIAYVIQNETLIAELVRGADHSNSNLVGIKGLKLLTVYAANCGVSFEISALGDYFAGSLSTQQAVIPPFGIPGFSNNVGGYIYVEPSENLANSTGWVILKVFYNQSDLGSLSESTVTLMYYNELLGQWEELRITELDMTNNFVTVNISHYSVFALMGNKPAPAPSFTKTDVGVTSNITQGNASELTAYLPPEYAGANVSDAVVLDVNVTDNNNVTTDDAYTDIIIYVGKLDVETCRVFKSDMGFLPEIPDVTMLPTVKPPGAPAFSRNMANNTVTVRLYVGDPLLAVLPLAEPIFDTGLGTYPSIPGTFNGTIRANVTITVRKLYTYPCAGTGGHTEYVAISYPNGTVLAEAHWNGYYGDWHNLTFNNAFTLYANETYNYTIRTGSYPQIIHEPSWNATSGVITCSEFVDVNGKRHEGWIPAIRLY